MKVIIPFKITSIPIKKLALISFEKDPDEVYRGLELQFLDGPPYGRGWRVIAYRNDNYVDVYDDNSLTTIENEVFDVAEKGLKDYTKTELRDVVFAKNDFGVEIGFKFRDLAYREILVYIQENTQRASKAMNLLAPIGSDSESPSSFPLFLLYDFDFVRKHKTKMLIEIDGKTRKSDNFPFPITKELQWRCYARYSTDCHMLEIGKDYEGILTPVELDEDLTYVDGESSYDFQVDEDEKGVSLKSIRVNGEGHQVVMVFEEPLPVEAKNDGEINGKFHITTDEVMGFFHGSYQWEQKNGQCSIRLTLDGGWSSVPNSFITKLILSPKSVFCTWPKSYEYLQEFNKENYYSKSGWVNRKFQSP